VPVRRKPLKAENVVEQGLWDTHILDDNIAVVIEIEVRFGDPTCEHCVEWVTRICVQRLGFDFIRFHHASHLQIVHAAADWELVARQLLCGIRD
jgi:hypothetical protein